MKTQSQPRKKSPVKDPRPEKPPVRDPRPKRQPPHEPPTKDPDPDAPPPDVEDPPAPGTPRGPIHVACRPPIDRRMDVSIFLA